MNKLRGVLKRHGAYPEQLYEELNALIKSETDKAESQLLADLWRHANENGYETLMFEVERRLYELQKPENKDDK